MNTEAVEWIEAVLEARDRLAVLASAYGILGGHHELLDALDVEDDRYADVIDSTPKSVWRHLQDRLS